MPQKRVLPSTEVQCNFHAFIPVPFGGIKRYKIDEWVDHVSLYASKTSFGFSRCNINVDLKGKKNIGRTMIGFFEKRRGTVDDFMNWGNTGNECKEKITSACERMMEEIELL